MVYRKKYNYQKKVGLRILGSIENQNNGIDTSLCISLEEALDIFVQAKKVEGCRERTINDYYKNFDYLLEFLNNEYPKLEFFHQLTPQHIRAYISFMQNKKVKNKAKDGLSPNTINIRLRTLKTMCNFLLKENLIPDNPMKNIKFVRLDEREELKGYSKEEINRLLNVIDIKQFAGYRDKILIYLYLDGGYRVSEAISLKVSDINFKDSLVTVKSEIEKTRRNRVIPISKHLLNMIRRLIDETEKYFGKCEYLFMSAFGEPLEPATFRRKLHRYGKKANVKHASPGRFRHTFARKYLLNGGDLFSLSTIMGHSNITTTRRYIQLDTDELKKQHKKYTPSTQFYKRPYAGKIE